jgi:hypothetical protein
MNKERLLTLAKFLEDLPKHKFMFSTWMSATDSAVDELEAERYAKALETRDKEKPAFTRINDTCIIDRVVVEPNLCQTVGCALGWAATIPEFKKAGLCLVSYWEDGTNDGFVVLFDNPKDTKHSTYSRDIEAAAKFFDIDYDNSQYLFLEGPDSPKGYTTAKDVAKAIRQMVKGHVEPVQA